MNRLRSLIRDLIREVLLAEGPPGSSISVDPTKSTRPYDYDIPRGVDIHSFWYRSPGRGMGTDGDPGRPEDAEEYVGLKAPDETGSSESGEV